MSMPYFPFYASDWLAGTRGLSAEETGIYITLIAMMYEREAPLDMPNDRLARLCGCGVKAFSKALTSLIDQRKIVRTDGGLWQDRVEKELQKLSARKDLAKSSANARWEKTKQKQHTVDANALQTQCAGDANQNQNQNQKEEEEGGDGSARDAILPVSQADDPTDRELILAAIGVDPVSGLTGRGGAMLGKAGDMAEAAQWLELPGLTMPLVCDEIRRIMAVKRDGPPKSFRYFTEAMQRLSGAMTLAPLQPIAPTAPAQPRDMWAEVEAELERRRQASADVLPFPKTADGA